MLQQRPVIGLRLPASRLKSADKKDPKMAAATTNGASSSSPPGFDPGQSPNYSFVPPSTPSPYLRAFFAYVDALHAWDFDRLMQCFDESLEHRILPKSLGRPVLNKRQYGEYFKGTMPLFVKFRLTIHEVIEAGHRMTVHASSKGESIAGAPYANEYTMIIHFTPAPISLTPGEDPPLPKMMLVKEYVDSAASQKFFIEERAKMKEIEKNAKMKVVL